MRHLRSLIRPVAAAGAGAMAPLVYTQPGARGAGSRRPVAAAETGPEGVACVDDAARAVVLCSLLWRRRPLPEYRDMALGLLRFLVYMQLGDGRVINFLRDWDGRRNAEGPTSRPGGPAWQARAAHAFACGLAAFGGDVWDAAFDAAIRWLDPPVPYLDVRAVATLAALEHWKVSGAPASRRRAAAWAEEIGAQCSEGRLLDAAGCEAVHLWGHLQEVALVEAGTALGRLQWVETARRSARALLLPAAARCRDAPSVIPFEVSCVVAGLAAVGRATADLGLLAGAHRAATWFHGCNAAGQPVYDPATGAVFDGIDERRVSRNAGAEATIEGALALLVWDPAPVDGGTEVTGRGGGP